MSMFLSAPAICWFAFCISRKTQVLTVAFLGKAGLDRICSIHFSVSLEMQILQKMKIEKIKETEWPYEIERYSEIKTNIAPLVSFSGITIGVYVQYR